MSDNRVNIEVTVNGSQAAADVRGIVVNIRGIGDAGEDASGRLRRANSAASASFGGLKSAIGGALAAFSVAEIASGVNEIIKANAEINLLTQSLHVSRNALQEWGIMGKQAGVEISDIFKDTSEKIGEYVATGGGEAKDVFEQLKLSAKDFKDLAPDQQILKVVEAMDKMPGMSQGQKIFLMESLANDASKVLPYLENDAAKLKEIQRLSQSSGAIITEEQNAILSEAGDHLGKIGLYLAGMGNAAAVSGAQLVNAFGPGLLSGIDQLSTEWAFFKDSLQFSDETAFVVLRGIGDAFGAIGDAIAPVTPYLADFGVAFAAAGVAIAVGSIALTAAGAAFALLTSPITLTIAAVAALAVAGQALYENWDTVTASFGELAEWWSGTTFDEKIIDIETSSLEVARSLSDDFFAWWDNSALKPVALELTSDAIDLARSVAMEFDAWWNSWTVREVTADVSAELIIFAWEKSQAFGAWWDSWNLFPKEGDVDTSLIEKAWSYVKSFVDWWNGISLKDLASGAMDALNSVKKLGGDIIDGLSDGISRATSHISAAKKAAGEVESTMRKELDTHSPSRVLAAVGRDSADGLASGLTSGVGIVGASAGALAAEVEKAAKKAAADAEREAKRIADAMNDSVVSLEALRLEYEEGATASAIYRKEQDGLSAAQARSVVAMDEQAQSYKDLISNRKIADQTYGRMLDTLDDEYSKLTMTTDEYQRQRLGVQGITGAKQDEILARQESVDELKAESQAYKQASDSLLNVFEDAVMNGKNLFDGLKKWISDLFSDLVLRPVLQPITAGITSAIMPGAAQAGQSGGGLPGLWGNIKGSLNAGGMTGAITSAGVAGGLVSLLGGTDAQSIGASIGAAAGNYLATAFSVAGPIGTAVGGILGVLAGGLFQDDDSPRGKFTGGVPQDGYAFADRNKKLYASSTLGTFGFAADGTHDLGEEGEKALEALVQRMAAIDNAVAKFMPTDEIDRVKQALSEYQHTGTDFETIVKARLQIISSGLSEGLQSLVDWSADADAVVARLDELLTIQQQVVPALQGINLQMGSTADAALVAAAGMADAAGGLQNLTALTDSYYKAVYSEEEQKQRQISTAQAAVDAFNAANGAQITTLETLRKYVEGLDLTVSGNQAVSVAAMGLADELKLLAPAAIVAAVAVADATDAMLDAAKAAQQEQQAIFGQFADSLGIIKDDYADALSDLTESYSEQISIFGKLQSAAKSLRDNIDKLKLSSNLTTLTPVKQLEEALRQFDTLVAKSPTDTTAAGQVGSAGEQYLQLLRAYYASGDMYATGFDYVTRAMDSVAGEIEAQRDPQLDMLAAQRDLLASADQQISSLVGIYAGIIGGNDLARMALERAASLPVELSGLLAGALQSNLGAAGSAALSQDQQIALAVDKADDLTSRGAQIASLYQTLLGRTADLPGLNYWQNSGMDLQGIAQSIARSQEAQTRQSSDLVVELRAMRQEMAQLRAENAQYAQQAAGQRSTQINQSRDTERSLARAERMR